MKIFTNDLEAEFVKRPNRFIIIAANQSHMIRVHCPNPGRLHEILVPGTKVILEKTQDPLRKTRYSLVGAYYQGKVIPLYSSRANQIFKKLILPLKFPDCKYHKAEYQFENSRFDFFIQTEKQEILIEVKACTLVEEQTAMFPDAPSERAKKHIEELAALQDPQTGQICFIINHRDAKRFIPNLHTDIKLYKTLLGLKEKIKLMAISIDTDSQGNTTVINPNIPIHFPISDLENLNTGIYMLLIHLEQPKTINIGKLGSIKFKKGYYIYCGSAKKNLKQRLARHLRRTKKLKWHIDYLINQADQIKDFPIYTLKDLECTLSQDLQKLTDINVKNFGSSDCHCSSHLYYFEDYPLHNNNFLKLLFHYRHTKAF
ncbi:MAG: DNA/RNA nuclease SfsA [Spirochaetes bacterium]|nr:DNA/RNA nuclease SfsA [Spirochaetota bacterium]